MSLSGKRESSRRATSRPAKAAWGALTLLLLAACPSPGPPPMEPLTGSALEAAERRWEAHGSGSYHLVVRVRAPRANPAVYDVVVAGGKVARTERDGRSVPPGETDDYSVPGLFSLLRKDLGLIDVPEMRDTPPIDLRARFEAETGRLVRYRRTVGSARRRVLLIEVLEYEPLAGTGSSSSG